jgi:hypothetical protein
VITRLGPLDPAATGELIDRLAARLGVRAPDPGEIHRRSGGSPFYVRWELAGHAPGGAAGDPLDASLR